MEGVAVWMWTLLQRKDRADWKLSSAKLFNPHSRPGPDQQISPGNWRLDTPDVFPSSSHSDNVRVMFERLCLTSDLMAKTGLLESYGLQTWIISSRDGLYKHLSDELWAAGGSSDQTPNTHQNQADTRESFPAVYWPSFTLSTHWGYQGTVRNSTNFTESGGLGGGRNTWPKKTIQMVDLVPKTLPQNVQIMQHLNQFKIHNNPGMVRQSAELNICSQVL